MSDTNFSYWMGWCFGVLSAIAFFLISTPFRDSPSNQLALDNCAKTHNVYQCEMVALPKGPK